MGFKCEKNKTSGELTLSLDNNKDYANNIFAENFEMTFHEMGNTAEQWYFGNKLKYVQCIVGKNGTGKTTILNEIRKYYESNDIPTLFYDGFLLMYDNKQQNTDIGINKTRQILNSIQTTDTNKNIKMDLKEISYFNNYDKNWESTLWDNAYFSKSHDISTNLYKYKTKDFNNETKSLFLNERESSYRPQTIMSTEFSKANDSIEIKRNILNEDYEFKKIKFGISQGELSRLKLFILLYEFISNFPKDSIEKEITVILDEPETHFHPEWSRNLINELLDFLNGNCKATKINLFISTHSPLIIADLPKKSVKYLDIDTYGKIINKSVNEKATFGEELNTLFIERFFLGDRRGVLFSNKLHEVYYQMASQIAPAKDCEVNKDDEGTSIQDKNEFIIENTSDIFIKQSLNKLSQIITDYNNGKGE